MERRDEQARARRAVELVAEILREAESYPWKTARYLTQRLATSRDFHMGTRALEDALLDHARSPERVVRYSFFPARKTLDLLWGHVRNIRDFGTLPDPFLELRPEFLAEVGEFEPCDLSDDAIWCFLSHNFRDLDQVRELRTELIARGYGVWIAEAEILEGAMITQAVQEGLERADRFVLYVTRRSLGSRWVLKEASVAVNRWKLPPTVVIDGGDGELVELFRPWVQANWDDGWLARGMDRLLLDVDEEPAATMLPDLLVGALRGVPRDSRRAVVHPAPEVPLPAGFTTLDAEFPRAGSSA